MVEKNQQTKRPYKINFLRISHRDRVVYGEKEKNDSQKQDRNLREMFCTVRKVVSVSSVDKETKPRDAPRRR